MNHKPRLVVGAAILRDGKVLAAQRSYPPELAGGWEFPGGKVELGESEEQALVRECAEELGATVRVTERIPGGWPVGKGYELRIWLADLLDGEPQALEDHGELRWLAPDEIDAIAWLPQDREAAALVAAAMTAAPTGQN